MSDEAKKTILIVDDEADVSTYLRAFFEDNGFTAVTRTARRGSRRPRSFNRR